MRAPRVCHYPDKAGDHRHYDSTDSIILICHVTSRDHVLKGSCESMAGSLSWYVTILPYFVAAGLVQV